MTATPAFRFAAFVAVVLSMLVSLAAPAYAHGRGSESTNFESRILQTPDLPGVTWEVIGGDQYLSVTNTSDEEVLIEGYQGEPYLRVGPEGVFHNVASEAAYLNADRYGEVGTFPPNVGPNEEPRWEQLSSGATYAWHDHRIHWMSPSLPPTVTDQGKETRVNPWEVPFTYGGDNQVIGGELWWVPAPSPLPWLLIGLVVTSVALLGLLRRKSEDWVRPMVRPAAAVLFVIALLNVTHLVDDFMAVPQPLATQLVSAVQTALFIGLGMLGAVMAWRSRDGAFTALGVGCGGIFLGQGVLYFDALTKVHSASVFPNALTRFIVGASLAQVIWVGAVAVLGNRRLAAQEAEAMEEPSEHVAAT